MKKKESNISVTIGGEVEIKEGKVDFTPEESVRIVELVSIIVGETAGRYKPLEVKDVIPCLEKIVFTQTGKKV